jgi:putative glutamine amidotransferase
VASPPIGISTAVEKVRWDPWEDVATMLPRSYADAVQRAGGLALLLPPDPAATEEPDLLLNGIDGLILSGGSDVDPATYGAVPHPKTGRTWPERDRFEIALARRAVERELPLLGICRGMHVLNVALGGTLIQHLPDVLGRSDHRHTPGSFGDHEVRLEPGSVAARASGTERLAVKSHHHQGLDELGEGLVASGWSPGDELVEAVELPEHPFALGVLWHPEEDSGSLLVGSLVAAADDAAGSA